VRSTVTCEHVTDQSYVEAEAGADAIPSPSIVMAAVVAMADGLRQEGERLIDICIGVCTASPEKFRFCDPTGCCAGGTVQAGLSAVHPGSLFPTQRGCATNPRIHDPGVPAEVQ
jgi:hypothetical protein